MTWTRARSGRAAAALGVAAVLFSASALADLRLPLLFSDHMLLQRDRAVPVWGWAAPGEQVEVAFSGQRKTAVTGADGQWRVTLDRMWAEPVGRCMQVRTPGAVVEYKDVVVGDVWLASGQSNMAMPVGPIHRLRGVLNYEEEIAAADYPAIRLFTVGRFPAGEPQEDVRRKPESRWRVCSPGSVRLFSACAYFFGRDLHQALNVPIGLINSSVGGTPAEAWTSEPYLADEPLLRYAIAQWPTRRKRYVADLAAYKEKLAGWEANASVADRGPKPPPPRPNVWPASQPGSLYNGMIAPLIPFALRGVIWNQGESNAGRYDEYRTLLPLLIRNWREQWGQGDTPFILVQLPNVGVAPKAPVDDPRARLREAQLLTYRTVPAVGMAVTCDVGEAGDTHARNKQAVGHRLHLSARAVAYGQDLVWSGPLYQSMTREGNRVRVRFEHVGGGLVARGEGGQLQHFAVAGKERQFVWAQARIKDDEVVVWSPTVKRPVAVRYAWASNPEGANLYNQEGLPASPFRTDSWPRETR